jgi:ABC-type antimicrobial peptide transport system permease subunit
VFYVAYLRGELSRRRGRTLLALLGLAIGVAVVIAIAALSRGLDHAQRSALNPLGSIGTDLTVTRGVDQNTGFGGGPFGGGFGANREVFQANQSALTDLSKLGKPGQHFVHDFFLPGSQLTFRAQQVSAVKAIPGVQTVSTGLTMTAVHQEGVVPKIVATFKTGGDTFRVNRLLPALTTAQRAKIRACFQKAFSQGPLGSGGGANGGGGNGGFGGGGGGGRTGGGGAPGGGVAACFPGRQRFRATFRTPQQTLKQVLNPPQTNITSTTYEIAGVDQTQPTVALVTPAQIHSGRYFSKTAKNEALLGVAYAKRANLKLGSTLDLNGTKFLVVGLVDPPLGGQSADVYLPLVKLQALAGQKGLANVALVKAASSSDVSAVAKAIPQRLQGAQVASAKQVASHITGSLSDARNLSNTLGTALAIVVAVAAFLMAALLSLASVAKRTRELGTLRALGWSKRLVVRQIVGESLVIGVIGGLVGIVLGILIAEGFDLVSPSLTASSTSGGSDVLGIASRTVSSAVTLKAPLDLALLVLGFFLALLGGLLAGAAGALRASRLRPADALRALE